MSHGPLIHHAHLDRLRKLVATLPEASEEETWDHPTFRVRGKIFATFGSKDGAPTLGVKQTKEQQAEWIQDEAFFVPAYVGQHGWVGMWARKVKWATVAELVLDSYRQVAPKKLVRQLEEGT